MIRVLPIAEAPGDGLPLSGAQGDDPLAWAAYRRFTPSGRSALEIILRTLALAPDDEVLITNASGQTYVSACVTCTVFNYCKPSRVLTDRTRAILVIHEYGYPHPRLGELRALAVNRGIALVEDCAHSFDSAVDGRPLGSFGEYAIFSLSKVLPVAAGGILVSAQRLPGGPCDQTVVDASAEAEVDYARHLPSMGEYSRRRRRNYEAVRQSFPELPLLLGAGPGVTPFYIGLLTPDAPEIRQRSAAVEWGSTLQHDLLLVTTNPFVDPQALVNAVESALTVPGAVDG